MKKIHLKKIKKEDIKIIESKIEKKVKNNNFFQMVKDAKEKKGGWYIFWVIVMCALILCASLFLIFALYIIISSPNFDKDLLYSKEATVLYDINGDEFARIGSENRSLVTYDDLPQVFVDALIATEDSRYFQHNGLDIARFLKASVKQITGSDEGGASTITMQVIKNLYTKGQNRETRIQSFIRKFRDIYMAVFKLENCYTKEEIMEFYVNSLWLGHDGNLNYSGIYGVEQASQYFFGKSVSDLTLAESSLLVGMYQNAYLYNPYRNPVGCRNRQKIVLKLMILHGYITEEEMNDVLAIPVESLLANSENNISTNENQAAIDYVLDEVEKQTKIDARYTPLKIYTTIDPKIQSVLNSLEKGDLFTFYNEKDQEGAAITSVENGSVVAVSGGRNYQAKGLNRAVGISRQPGSTAKPFFDYGPYLEHMNGSTGDYLFDNEYTYSNGTPIADADKTYQGMITLRQSLVGSRNITALQTFQKVAKEDISIIEDYVHSFGINYGTYLYESAAIGGFEGMSPLEMSAAYGTYARGGYYIKPYIFTKIVYENGTSDEFKYSKEKVVSEETSYMITSMLMDAVKDGWSGNINVTGTQVAGKTGTTTIDDASIEKLKLPYGTIMDSWSVTYSPEYAIAVWYGYDTLNKDFSMNTTTGWNARSKIMSALANRIYSANKTFKMPSGVIPVEVEKFTVPLQLASPTTPADFRMTELFKEGTEPTEVSNRFSKLSTPTNGKSTVTLDKVKLTWSKIETPKAIDHDFLEKYFNDNYGQFATKYYEERLDYNNSYMGKIGYQVYLQNSDKSLTSLAWVENGSYTQSIELGKTYTFVIKSAYNIFKNNMSDGLTIKVTSLSSGEDNPDDEKETPDENTTTNTTKDTGLD